MTVSATVSDVLRQHVITFSARLTGPCADCYYFPETGRQVPEGIPNSLLLSAPYRRMSVWGAFLLLEEEESEEEKGERKTPTPLELT